MLQVLAIGPECDIALLSVEDENFWKGVEPLRFGSLPRLQVSVVAHSIFYAFSLASVGGSVSRSVAVSESVICHSIILYRIWSD